MAQFTGHPRSPEDGSMPTHECAGVLLAQWLPDDIGTDPKAFLSFAAGQPQRFGELLAAARPHAEPVVADALTEQKRTGESLGEVLVRKGALSEAERDTILEFQRHQRQQGATEERLRLGQILVSERLITQKQLDDALKRHRESGRALGEELVAAGHISKDALHHGLQLQRKLVAAVLCAALGAASVGSRSAEASQSVSQSVHFTIKVPPVVRVQMMKQPHALEITASDVERGYMELSAASLVQVTANCPYQVNFLPNGQVIRSARVSGLESDILVGPEGSSRTSHGAARPPAAFQLSYRFELAAGVQPGTYPWPLAVSAHAI
jgi:hypothetical protein